jgi:uncharacterized protein (UPF0335 family)
VYYLIALDNEEVRLQQLTALLKSLPAVHRATSKKLFYLLHHMSNIPEYRMDTYNLAIVWSPNLIRQDNQPDSSAILASTTSPHGRALSSMIQQYNELFGHATTPAVSPHPNKRKKSREPGIMKELEHSTSTATVTPTTTFESSTTVFEDNIHQQNQQIEDDGVVMEEPQLDTTTESIESVEVEEEKLDTDIQHIIEIETRRLNGDPPLHIQTPKSKFKHSSIVSPQSDQKIVETVVPMNQLLQEIVEEYEEDDELVPVTTETRAQPMDGSVSKSPIAIAIPSSNVNMSVQQIDEVKIALSSEIQQIKRQLQSNENSTVNQLQDLMERFDTIENWVQQISRSNSHIVNNVQAIQQEERESKKYKHEVKGLRSDISNVQKQFGEITEKVNRLEFIHNELINKMDEVLKEHRFTKVKSDYELEHLKRQVETHSVKMRDFGLEMSTVKSKMDARLTYNAPILKSFTPPLLKTRSTEGSPLSPQSPIDKANRTSVNLSAFTDMNNQNLLSSNIASRRLSTSGLLYNNSTTPVSYKPNSISSSLLDTNARRKSLLKSGMYNFDQLKSKFQV